MSILLRALLFLVSVVSLIFVLKKIRNSQTQIESAVFWIIFMFGLVAVSVFPDAVIYISGLIGIDSPANFVFLCIIFLLLLKVFLLSLQLSRMQYQIQQLTQIISLEKFRRDMKQMKNKVEQQKEHFNSIAQEYYSMRQNPNSLLFKKLLWKYVFKQLPPPDSMFALAVLEPMCGYGEGEKIVKDFYSENIQYTGFDYSDKLIEIVKELYPSKNVFVQDVTVFKSEREYDLIILIGGLHHVPDYTLQILKNLRKSLKEGGYFINFEPTHGNGITGAIRKRIYNSNSVFDAETERDYSVKELNKLYHDADFEIFKQLYPGLLAYTLYYNPDVFPRLACVPAWALNALFSLERPFYQRSFAAFSSFATLTILK